MEKQLEYYNLFTLEEFKNQIELDSQYILYFGDNEEIQITINTKKQPINILTIQFLDIWYNIDLIDNDWQKEITIDNNKYILGYKKETNYIYFGRII